MDVTSNEESAISTGVSKEVHGSGDYTHRTMRMWRKKKNSYANLRTGRKLTTRREPKALMAMTPTWVNSIWRDPGFMLGNNKCQYIGTSHDKMLLTF